MCNNIYRIMYWCDSSYKPYIGKAGMDGNGITLFVTKKLKRPKGLTIDYPNNRLYWLDTDLEVIESIQLDGTDRKVSYYIFFITRNLRVRRAKVEIKKKHVYNLIIYRLYRTI